MHIDATIICERDSHKGIIIGKQGSMLKKIGSTARYEIERMLEFPSSLFQESLCRHTTITP